MGVYIYPTDQAWFDHLSVLHSDDVNFWRPGLGSNVLKALPVGGILLFRLKGRINKIAGGGVFVDSLRIPIYLAWQAFGQANGTPTFEKFKHAIETYRKTPVGNDDEVVCIMLKSPFFLPPESWREIPFDYDVTAQQGKYFPLTTITGSSLFEWAQSHLAQIEYFQYESAPLVETKKESTKRLILSNYRVGQGSFRVLVSEAYERRCAITGERTLPVLDAAHIVPDSCGGEMCVTNGVLLRTDLHRLFDAGYLTITPRGTLRVSVQLRHDWQNGRVYYDMEGTQLRMPGIEPWQPNSEALTWHNDIKFKRLVCTTRMYAQMPALRRKGHPWVAPVKAGLPCAGHY